MERPCPLMQVEPWLMPKEKLSQQTPMDNQSMPKDRCWPPMIVVDMCMFPLQSRLPKNQSQLTKTAILLLRYIALTVNCSQPTPLDTM